MAALTPPTWSPPDPVATERPVDVPAVRRRIAGIDMARALAILGMVMVHVGPFQPDTSELLGRAYRVTHGRASVLFVLLAGVGVSLLFASRPPGQARIRIGWRVIVFFPVGVALQALPTPVAVILHFYAAYLLLGGVLGTLPTRWLVAVTGVWTAVGPMLFLAFVDPELAGRGAAATLSAPFEIVLDLMATGYYPLLTWAPPLLVGMLVGRTDLRDATSNAVLVGGGAVVAAAAYGASELLRAQVPASVATSPYLIAEGHTGAPLNVLGATAVAVAVLGLCLLVAAWLPRLSWPMVAVGQMALTIYVVHLLLLAVVPEWLEARDDVGTAFASVGRFFLITTLICVAWRARFARGPLEALVVLPFSVRSVRSVRSVHHGPPPVPEGRTAAPPHQEPWRG